MPGLQAIIHVEVRGESGWEEVEAAIDTGFSGFLALPASIVARLDLEPRSETQIRLADGSDVSLRVHRAVVLWNREERTIEVLQADSGPLLGMALLHGSEVKMQVVNGGGVTIETLRP